MQNKKGTDHYDKNHMQIVNTDSDKSPIPRHNSTQHNITIVLVGDNCDKTGHATQKE